MRQSYLGFKKRLSARFRGLFPRLYSALDEPQEVPVQIAAYRLVTDKYLQPSDAVLDVGFGLGYGLKIMSTNAARLVGLEVDRAAVKRGNELLLDPRIQELGYYDGYSIPFPAGSFDVITCIDVIEHVPDYDRLLRNLCKVARRSVILSTPNRRMEFTNPDGTPRNPWHIREWSYSEFDQILQQLNRKYEWNFINGPWEGPFSISQKVCESTMALTPTIIINQD